MVSKVSCVCGMVVLISVTAVNWGACSNMCLSMLCWWKCRGTHKHTHRSHHTHHCSGFTCGLRPQFRQLSFTHKQTQPNTRPTHSAHNTTENRQNWLRETAHINILPSTPVLNSSLNCDMWEPIVQVDVRRLHVPKIFTSIWKNKRRFQRSDTREDILLITQRHCKTIMVSDTSGHDTLLLYKNYSVIKATMTIMMTAPLKHRLKKLEHWKTWFMYMWHYAN